MTVITAKIIVKPEKKQELLDLAAFLVEHSRQEEGNISYNFYSDVQNSNVFVFVEEWANQQAIDYHFGTPHFQQFGVKGPDLFQGKPDINIYEVANVKKG